MLIQSLFQFAAKTKVRHGATILESPEYESRPIAWVIDLSDDGTLRGFVPLWDNETKGKVFEKVPRTLEPKDSGEVAEFLVEDPGVILGLGVSPGESPVGAAQKKHRNFWTRIEAAQRELHHPLLGTLLRWRGTSLDAGKLHNPKWESYTPARGKAKDQWVAEDSNHTRFPLYFRQNTSIDATFKIGGTLLIEDDRILSWWKEWFAKWLQQREAACKAARGGGRVCVVTAETDAPLANSHLPKIKNIPPPALGVGASLVSAEASSFHSYGLSIQRAEIPGAKSAPDASYSNVSVRGAIAYCDALNFLLADDDHHYRVDPIVFCFWCRDSTEAHRIVNLILNKAYPEQVRDMFAAPYGGRPPQDPTQSDRLYTVALSGNAGRVIVKRWLDQTLAEASANLHQWWEDLQIIPVYNTNASDESQKKRAAPYSLRNLADATVRRSKRRKNDNPVADRLVELYLAALKNTALSVALLKPILDEFQSAYVKDSSDKPTYPFSQSRFALIKLILIRTDRKRKESDFMPTSELADTADAAYNLGRLLAVFENLQDKYHNYEKKGPGVVEHYYGTASSAPAAVFPLLCRLARHHLGKLKKGDDSDKKAAYRIEERVMEILAKFQPEATGKPPVFPRILRLEQQGRFALGFYQQKALKPKSDPTATLTEKPA
jgi:CRISPR-associated protein Csd1